MMTQTPAPGSYWLKWRGDTFEVRLRLATPRAGRAQLRTDIGGIGWHDVPMTETEPGLYRVSLALNQVGIFSAKACFFPEGEHTPEWPDGANARIKVEPNRTRRGNSIYTVFPRQFGTVRAGEGTFRGVARQLPHIMDRMGFRIVQLLPVFPVPTTFARMGKMGCPFAATDFLSVDPALAEFDTRATPLDQFCELVDAVHARAGFVYLDLPANHTGWAATLQTHHPEWYHRRSDGEFVSPGAWGVTWADLVELDYSHEGLRDYMADVFLFWARLGVDGFRCDAGYMIPEAAWAHIVRRVRAEYPGTVFMLEGLGGKIEVTDRLLSRAGLDWAYSEIFQTYDRRGFEWYLPGAIARAETFGTLVHFAETHDNDRLAKGGETYAQLRVQLAALLSHQGAWGIANGVEWFATEKIDVHDANALNWGAAHNQVDLIARLNQILNTHPSFGDCSHLAVVTRGDGNTLAVARTGLLVLANLDCGAAARIQWDAAAFPACEAKDLVRGRVLRADPHAGVELAPGEVLCLEDAFHPAAAISKKPVPLVRPEVASVWRYPEDVGRDVAVPSGALLLVRAHVPFRAEWKAGACTRAYARASACGVAGRYEVILQAPAYAGDGTRCDDYTLRVSAFTPDGVRHVTGRLFVAPPRDQARARVKVSGGDIRRDPTLRALLSNGAGADTFIPLSWGTIRSQYDALFAANPNPRVPSDRLVLWTRCRAWLQYAGYSHELNADCTESCAIDPAGRWARWIFTVPCTLGRAVRFEWRQAFVPERNVLRVCVRRLAAAVGELDEHVRLVLRPDLEWRSFHETTKAFAGPEQTFPAGVKARTDGFSFAPFGGAAFVLTATGGTFHLENEWTYNVPHPDEQERGQTPAGDLFSPGWFSADFAAADSEITLTAAYGDAEDVPAIPEWPAESPETLPLEAALEAALEAYLVRRDDLKTVIAGYPWFLDWGRDTFIFLRGAIAAGRTQVARAILVAFARFEENGTLPNVIYGETAGNRDTADAQLWFAVALRDLVAKEGKGVLKTSCGNGRTLHDVLVSIAENYVKGTPNGICMDSESALVWCPSHFTWMDTNYPACTPREGYPVEIQALWIAMLRFLGGKWNALAKRAADSLVRLYVNETGLADCLDATAGMAAAQARRDDAVRPNALFALTLDVLPHTPEGRQIAARVLDACGNLLVPGGIRSLDVGDGRYRGVYAGDEDRQRKPAYHNGTAWGWTAPLYAEALVQAHPSARTFATALLASFVDALNGGCVGHLPEILDGDTPHAQKGCRAQAWSASELLRVLRVLNG